MPLISLLINCDTRSEKNQQTGLFGGTVNIDYLTDGVFNKQKFLSGFDFETIVYIDKHEEIPEEVVKYLRSISDTLIIRKHTSEPNFNDWNYIRCLRAASGDIIFKFDQDTSAFSNSKQDVEDFIGLLNDYDFVSYPSIHSPFAAHDNSFDHTWVSTRFFMCKRKSLDIPEIIKCFDYDYWCSTYPVNRKCPWTEHWIGSIAKYRNQKVYYPPVNHDKLSIFTWGRYETYTLRRLNELPYEEIKSWLNSHPIVYPNDIYC